MLASLRGRQTLVAVVLVAAFTLASCGSEGKPEGNVAGLQVQNPDGLAGNVLPDPYDVPDVTLEDTTGASYDLSTATTKPLTLVFFGYTNCPDICQVVMAEIAAALNRLEPADRAQVGVLFVTTDPARDDATTLRSYLDRFDPDFEGLTGPIRTIVSAGDAMGVAVEKGHRLPTGGYDVTHGTNVIGLLPDGTAPLVWTQSTGAAQLADDIATILDDGVPDMSGSAS